tara:strand:- start:4255 stop:4908 length:654 start_codon:yes stop_codon:yes gene_type:complete
MRPASSLIASLIATLLASPAPAGPVPFDDTWSTQRFSLFSSNTYGFEGDAVSILSDGTVSMAYRQVEPAQWGAKRAAWGWEVSRSVPATDLTLKGGDDRNASLYFVFMPPQEARALGAKPGIRKLLTAESARVLVYVWGDNRARGTMLDSPYLGKHGKTIVLRKAGTGRYSEKVNLAADYARAFGGPAGALVGLAVSADSDDTDTTIRARITGLSLN